MVMLREPPVEVTLAERTQESRRRADRARRRGEEPEREREREGARDRLRFRIEELEVAPPAEAGQQLVGEEPVREPSVGAQASEGEAVGNPPAEGLPAPAAAPEPGITAEEVAAREAEAAAAQAALESAADSPGLMAAFQQAPPTVKAQVSGELGTRLNGVLGTETRAVEESTPEIQVELNGNTPAQPGEVPIPDAGAIDLEPVAPPPAPEAEVVVGEAVANEGVQTANQGVLSSLRGSYRPENGAESVERALDNVSTSAPASLLTSPGSPPPVEQSGETDPQRFQNQVGEGSRQAREALAAQQQAVSALPGVERVQLADVHEAVPVGELPVPGVAEAPAPEGAQQYLQMGRNRSSGLTPDVQTAFDGLAGPSMQESMAEAQGQMQQAVNERDQQHSEQVAQAQEQAAEAQHQAETDQRARVGETRGRIDSERQSVRDQQEAAVADAENQAEDRRQADREQFDNRVRSDQERIDTHYNEAERDATAEVREGERRAEAEQARAERESENQSWWEKALDFIADLFDALVGLINGIFDAVRSAVNTILDAARDFAIGLIELAASALKGLISAFGEFLKGLVQGLLGDIFPGLARALTQVIDGAVALANSAIDVIADGLKSAVNSIVEGLRAGLNRLIDIYQSAVNAAVALARAALTGDWGAFILQILEAACRVVGIDPEEMYAFIGRAQETIQLIIDNPGQFLSNALDALMGGFRRFADNFLTHLQAGIIGWLTGALGGAGITLPERFDLMGVISLVAQILGLTWENLRVRLVRMVGERGVQVLEFVAGYVQALIEGGWAGLWERIQNDLATLRDMVLDQIRTFLVERIIMAAVTRLATLFNPVGALVNILLAAYNFYTFIRDQIQRIYTVVQTIVDAIGNIARGVLGPAQERIESFLAGLLPLAIDLLARLIGLGNVGERVRAILQRVQDTLWGAIDRLIERVVGLFRGGQGQVGEAPETPGNDGDPSAPTGPGQIGERLEIRPPGQAVHHLYIAAQGTDATLVVESEPKTIGQLVGNVWGRQLHLLPNDPPEQKRDEAQRLLEQLRNGNSEAEQAAERQLASPGRGSGAPAAGANRSENVLTYERNLVSILTRLFTLFAGHASEAPSAGSAELLQRWDYELRIAEPSAAQQLYNDLAAHAGQLQDKDSWRQILQTLETSDSFYRHPLLQGTFANTVHDLIQATGTGPGGNGITDAFNEMKAQYDNRQEIIRAARAKGYSVQVQSRQVTIPANVQDFIRSRVALIHTEPARPPFSRALTALRSWVVDRANRNAAMGTLVAEYAEALDLYYRDSGPTHHFFEPFAMDDSQYPTIKYRYREIQGPEFEVTAHAGDSGRTITGRNLQLTWARPEIARGSRGVTQASYGPDETLDVNASHLIADLFMGSGHEAARNLVTASTYYNQDIMADKEVEIAEWIRSFRSREISLRQVTFNMTVNASWGPPVITPALANEMKTQIFARLTLTDEERQQLVQDFETTHQSILTRGEQVKRILGVTWSVQVFVNGAPSGAPRTFQIGPDIYLGLDANMLRRFLPPR